MNAALTQELVALAQQAAATQHGHRQGLYQEAAARLGMSLATLHRQLKLVTVGAGRKQRADAGSSALGFNEAQLISAYWQETRRKTGKRLASLKQVLEDLRSNGLVGAAVIDHDTGEWMPLSESTVARALKAYKLHPDQLERPAPKVSLKSAHPNHVWQIDPSLCVLYYLPKDAGAALQWISNDEVYKNKPGNAKKIELQRVWRYVVTDHCSGLIHVHYVPGAESGQNLVDAFITACQKSDHPSDPFHGLPRIVMVDPGSANTGAIFQNLCRQLGVEVWVNQPHQPWAKGQVEKANDIVECHFESRLRFLKQPITSIAELNDAAGAWERWFNAHETHRRHGQTRYAMWQRITNEQLRLAPPAELMRAIATSAPETRKITPQLTVNWRSQEFDVRDIPGVMVGEQLQLVRNPWRDADTAQVLYKDADGRDVLQVVTAIEKDEFGFRDTAALIGDEFKAHKDTVADTHRKQLEQLVTQTTSADDAKLARKQKVVPFGGNIDPMKPMTDVPLPDYLPKRGTEHQLTLPTIETATLNLVDAARALSVQMGSDWKPAHYQWLEQRYPDGVKEDAIPGIAQQLRGGATTLRAVKGGDA